MNIRYVERKLEDDIRSATNRKAVKITRGVLEVIRDPNNPDVILDTIRGVDIEISDATPLTASEQTNLDTLFANKHKDR